MKDNRETLLVSDEVYEITVDTNDQDHEVMVYIFDMIDDAETCMFITPDEARRLDAILNAIADKVK